MSFVVGDVVKTTVALAADDGIDSHEIPKGTLVLVHECPSDNAGLYSVSFGYTVYDVEPGEIEAAETSPSCGSEQIGGNNSERINHEVLWMRGIQLWLDKQLYLNGGASASSVAASECLHLWKQYLDSAKSLKPTGTLAQRLLFFAVILRSVDGDAAALPYFELAVPFLRDCAICSLDVDDVSLRDLLEIGYREYADVLEQLGYVERARAFVSKSVEEHVLWTNEWQRPHFMFASLDARPYWMLDDSWISELENDVGTVQDELQALMRAEGLWRHETRPHALAHGKWREHVIFGKGGNPSVAPKTAALVKRVLPSAVDLCAQGAGEVLFSALGPNTHVAPHCAPHNLRLTAHLGLIVPPPSAGRCALRVREEWREWLEGKVVIFDDSFEHEVVNETAHIRVVLLIRFWHPTLAADSTRQALALEQFWKQEDLRMKFKALPPLGCSRLQLRMLDAMACAQCGKFDKLAIRFAWEGVPRIDAICTCGAILSTGSDGHNVTDRSLCTRVPLPVSAPIRTNNQVPDFLTSMD